MQQAQVRWCGTSIHVMQHSELQNSSFFQSCVKDRSQNTVGLIIIIVVDVAVAVDVDGENGNQSIVKMHGNASIVWIHCH
jgi:hypothetical protein